MPSSVLDSRSRRTLHDLLSAVRAHEPHEQSDLTRALGWVEDGSPLYRTTNARGPHLCAYLVPLDHARGRILLVDHIKARLWLPAGGHTELHEDPRDTVRREAMEELQLDAEFHPMFGDMPFFVTINPTGPPSNCTDLTLWFIIEADTTSRLSPDPGEMRDLGWYDLANRHDWNITSDQHLDRFLAKLVAHLAAN